MALAVGGDDRVPGLPGGDHGVKVPQDRGGDDGLRLGGPQLVLLPAGQVLVAGPVDAVGKPQASAGPSACSSGALKRVMYHHSGCPRGDLNTQVSDP